jgi:hypothetical protein
MDWFERLAGFRETSYEETRRQFEVSGNRLYSRVNRQGYGIGQLELVSLQTLRERVNSAGALSGKLKVSVVTGDVRQLHQAPEYVGALFQVASQFNMLEMTSPAVTPEHGVTRYETDRTQGPACAIAAGAATIYRNYFAPVAGRHGQTAERQFDGLADLGAFLGNSMGSSPEDFWTMRNGYALCTDAGLAAIAAHLRPLNPDGLETLGGKLRIGIHRDVEVTDAEGAIRPSVSQAFCAALPVAYSQVPAAHWRQFASLVLDAAYEATLWAAVLNARRGASNIVLLTSLGGGAFGNDDGWIDAAMRKALKKVAGFGLDVRLVSYGSPSPELLRLAEDFC